jgi:hypothetical protein
MMDVSVDRAETAFKDRVKDVCVKPFKLLVLEPILQAMTLYMWVCRRPMEGAISLTSLMFAYN